jgi:hypothetical protein
MTHTERESSKFRNSFRNTARLVASHALLSRKRKKYLFQARRLRSGYGLQFA